MPHGLSAAEWEAALERAVVDSCAAQGVPEEIEDRTALEKIAGIVGHAERAVG